MILEVDKLELYYGDAQALDGVSLHAEEGELVAIVGANGAGKSSLIRTIAGIETPRAGRIAFRGRDITGQPSYRTCNLGIGQVAEGRQVFPSLSVEEKLRTAELPAIPDTWNERVDTVTRALTERYGHTDAWQLAERQSSAIGRLLAAGTLTGELLVLRHA